MAQELQNNKATVCGTILQEPLFTHEYKGEKFYETVIGAERKSGEMDMIPALIPERAADISHMGKGACVYVKGSFRSRNEPRDGKVRLMLNLFAEETQAVDKTDFTNCVELDGFLCKPPIYRRTPMGRRITDLFIAVNRNYGKSDYIPCIAWGRDAGFTSSLPVGSHLACQGRIQSRHYLKDGKLRTAYEVSLSSIALLG